MKNSTVNSGNSRSKINSVGVGQPNNRRKSAIVQSMVSPASMPATNPQKIDLMSGRGREAVELLISQFSRSCSDIFDSHLRACARMEDYITRQKGQPPFRARARGSV